jgi:hypothetical protein
MPAILTQRFSASQDCLSRPMADGATLGAGTALDTVSEAKHRGDSLPETG